MGDKNAADLELYCNLEVTVGGADDLSKRSTPLLVKESSFVLSVSTRQETTIEVPLAQDAAQDSAQLSMGTSSGSMEATVTLRSSRTTDSNR